MTLAPPVAVVDGHHQQQTGADVRGLIFHTAQFHYDLATLARKKKKKKS
jgi:hypothetical protein